LETDKLSIVVVKNLEGIEVGKIIMEDIIMKKIIRPEHLFPADAEFEE